MAEKQQTLKGEITLSGVGLHTGESVNLKILPAPEKHGYKFQRIDIENQPIIKADPDNVVSTARGTTLEENGAKVYTTEHVLAALAALQVDNALIQLDGPEVPILDGSSHPYIEAMNKVGFQEQEAEREYFILDENIKWEDPEKGIEFLMVPDEEY